MAERSKQEVLDYLSRAEVGAVGTSNMGLPRQRMMHFAVDEEFNFYLTSTKGDPKVIQWINIPETAILIHQGSSFIEMEECEIIGRAEVLSDDRDRQKAIELLVDRSPIVGQFHKIGALDRLEFIIVKPFTVKYRFVPEILQGEPPTVFDFEHNRENVNVWDDVKAKARAWKEAIRPLSLTAAFVPILLGGALSLSHTGQLHALHFILTMIGAIFIQAGTNMINDWKDAERDNENRTGIRPFTGGSRVIQLGLISRADMCFFGITLSSIATIIGIYLIFVSGYGILPLIAYGLIAGIFYTAGKGKLSFINMAPGVAEFLIATTYGVLMTMGAYYVQTGYFTLESFLMSLPVALFVSNVLLINQFPDAESDAITDKKTLVVRIGKRKAKNFLIVCFIVGYALIALLPIAGYAPYSIYFAFLSIPFAFQAIRYAQQNYDKNAADIIPSNAHTAINHLFNGLLLVFAFLLNSLTLLVPLLFLAGSLILVFWVWNYIERHRRVMNEFRLAFKK
jgi:1,4-dihydroxy-2-naphthoate octaprenyltransferase